MLRTSIRKRYTVAAGRRSEFLRHPIGTRRQPFAFGRARCERFDDSTGDAKSDANEEALRRIWAIPRLFGDAMAKQQRRRRRTHRKQYFIRSDPLSAAHNCT